MAIIHVLDKHTINQIAAGEVVERPASIVKELVENAVDAKSTAITIEIKGGGIDFIRITDNGSGIEKEQVPTAFLRHATSKITDASDLETVASLGFRGEALSSIAAVAKVELITKTDEGISGVHYVIEGGEEIANDEIGCPEGTTFIVRDLFFNTPARRKFLKSKMTEAGYVEAFVQRLALSHPEISFRFICDNKNKISTSGNGNLKDVIYHIFGREFASNLLEVKAETGNIRISGFIGKPVISRGNRNYENYFVNGRYLKSNIISKAIEDGYKGHAMVHKFPFTVLMIEMDAHYFDVNVHPAKMEMRFENGEELYATVMAAVKQSFVHKELIPTVGIGRERVDRREKITSAPEPFEQKRRKIEEHFRNLSQETIDEINQKKKEDGRDEDAAAIQTGKMSAKEGSSRLQEKLSRLKLNNLEQVKTEICPVFEQVKTERVSFKDSTTQNGDTREDPVDKAEINTGQNQGMVDKAQTSASQSQGMADKAQTNASQSQGLVDKTFTEKEQGSGQVSDSFAYGNDPKGEQMSFSDLPLLSEEARSRHRIIGQAFHTYWLVEFEDKLFFVDQHAAHEKVMYERMKKNLKEKKIDQQMVAPPIILNLSMREKDAFLSCQKAFEELGYQVEEFGPDAYAIRAVPANLYGINQQDLFMDILDQVDENMARMDITMITDKLASMSCKAAVKGNQRISYKEMDALMDQLLQLEDPYQCPHGRPTIISMTKYEIEKKFSR